MELHRCEYFKEKRRRGKVETGEGFVYCCTNHALDSSRLFKEKRSVLKDVLPRVKDQKDDIRREERNKLKRHIHNLVSLNASSRNSIFAAIPQDKFIQRDRFKLIEEIEQEVRDRPKRIAELIIDLLKNENLEKTEFAVYKKIFESEDVDKRKYSIHKITLLILNSFWKDFADKGISFDIGSCYEEVFVDFDVLAASFVHIIENAVKYILPDSTLKINFSDDESTVRVEFSMVSFKIAEEEVDNIWLEGYSGQAPRQVNRNGDGIGLFLVRRLTSLIDVDVRLVRGRNTSLSESRMGVEFENNVFIFDIPKAGES
jgi:signal transduction histidine kinase